MCAFVVGFGFSYFIDDGKKTVFFIHRACVYRQDAFRHSGFVRMREIYAEYIEFR